jgi:hypothetical protein
MFVIGTLSLVNLHYQGERRAYFEACVRMFNEVLEGPTFTVYSVLSGVRQHCLQTQSDTSSLLGTQAQQNYFIGALGIAQTSNCETLFCRNDQMILYVIVFSYETTASHVSASQCPLHTIFCPEFYLKCNKLSTTAYLIHYVISV